MRSSSFARSRTSSCLWFRRAGPLPRCSTPQTPLSLLFLGPRPAVPHRTTPVTPPLRVARQRRPGNEGEVTEGRRPACPPRHAPGPAGQADRLSLYLRFTVLAGQPRFRRGYRRLDPWSTTTLSLPDHGRSRRVADVDQHHLPSLAPQPAGHQHHGLVLGRLL